MNRIPRLHRHDWVALAALGLILGLITFRLPHFIDIGLGDESHYLANGLSLRAEGFPSPQWAPLYAMWYFLGAQLFTPATLYYVNDALLITAVPLLMYAYLRRNSVTPAVAGTAALLYAVSFSNVQMWPHVVKFAGLILMLGLLAMTQWRHTRWHKPLFVGLCLALTFIRPEFALSFVLAMAGYSWLTLRARKTAGWRQQSTPWLLLAALLATALLLWGNPLAGNRSDVAFQQHFVVNYVRWEGLDVDPWSNTRAVYTAVFGEMGSLSDAVRQHPTRVLRHIISNITVNLVAAWPKVLLVHNPNGVWWVTAVQLLQTTLLGGGLLWGGVQFWRKRYIPKPVREVLLTAAVLGLPLFASMTLVYPRLHYFQMPAILLYLLWAQIAQKGWQRLAMRWPKQGGAVGVVLGYLLLGMCTAVYTQPAETPHRSAILALEALPLTTPQVRYLSINAVKYGYQVYLGGQFEKVYVLAQPDNFTTLLNERNIDVLVDQVSLSQHPYFANDPTFWAFVEQPEMYGYTPQQYVNQHTISTQTLWVRTSMLAPQ